MSDHTISEFTHAKQSRHVLDKFNVEIGDIDESWALKLLNECEAEEAIITLASEGREESPRFRQDQQMALVSDETDMSSQRILSAIECQKLAYEQRQQARLEAELAGKNKFSSSFSRLKAFFAA